VQAVFHEHRFHREPDEEHLRVRKNHRVLVNLHVGVHYLGQMAFAPLALIRGGCSDDQMVDVSFYALPF
jgi:hypothetical protein